MFAGAMLVAVVMDAVIGWPALLFAAIGHPVTWLGAAISALDRALNRDTDPAMRRRLSGVAVVVVVAGGTALVAVLLVWFMPQGWVGSVLTGILAWPFVAMRSLHDHVAAVERPLIHGDIAGARGAVAMIVGRDPDRLDAPGVVRAALESLAENTSDGVVAPLFWGVLLGLPGIAAYKAINTMDSMIGHKSPRFCDFGWAAARLDDLVNLAPARLTGVLFAAVAHYPSAALRVMWRDAGKHRSPNAGWPEAAMAGGLGIRLSGPRAYGAEISAEPWVNDGAPDPDVIDMAHGLHLFRIAMAGLAAVLAIAALI